MSHDGNPNSIGSLTPQQQVLALAGLTLAGVVVIPFLYPHDGVVALSFLGLMTQAGGALVNLKKTQDVQNSLCETAIKSDVKREEIKALLVENTVKTLEVKDLVNQNTDKLLAGQAVAVQTAVEVKETLIRESAR